MANRGPSSERDGQAMVSMMLPSALGELLEEPEFELPVRALMRL